MKAEKEMKIISRASQLFEEPERLEQVACFAGEWVKSICFSTRGFLFYAFFNL
jgi:hypothetical protein